jgi:hypothetical protein
MCIKEVIMIGDMEGREEEGALGMCFRKWKI